MERTYLRRGSRGCGKRRWQKPETNLRDPKPEKPASDKLSGGRQSGSTPGLKPSVTTYLGAGAKSFSRSSMTESCVRGRTPRKSLKIRDLTPKLGVPSAVVIGEWNAHQFDLLL